MKPYLLFAICLILVIYLVSALLYLALTQNEAFGELAISPHKDSSSHIGTSSQLGLKEFDDDINMPMIQNISSSSTSMYIVFD